MSCFLDCESGSVPASPASASPGDSAGGAPGSRWEGWRPGCLPNARKGYPKCALLIKQHLLRYHLFIQGDGQSHPNRLSILKFQTHLRTLVQKKLFFTNKSFSSYLKNTYFLLFFWVINFTVPFLYIFGKLFSKRQSRKDSLLSHEYWNFHFTFV